MDTVEQVPSWLVRPLPTNAQVDAKLGERIARLGEDLPANLGPLTAELNRAQSFVEYDAAANLASVAVWQALDRCYAAPEPATRIALLRFAEYHMRPEAVGRICRRLALDPATH